MSDYISRSKLKAHYSWLGKDATLSPKDVDDIIDAQPAADVEPVVRGEWKDVYMSSASSFVGTCSVCHQSNDIPPPRNAHYCPNCGARMKDGANE